MNRCKTCRHFKPDTHPHRRKLWPSLETVEIAYCMRIRGSGNWALADEPAYTSGDDGCDGVLIVTEDFGCVLHEPATPQEPVRGED